MINNKFWSDIRFMFFLSLICGILLAGSRLAIGEKAELSEKTINAIYDILEEEISTPDLYTKFNTKFKKLSIGRIKIWQKEDNKNIYACEANGNGMWGEITLVFVIDKSKNSLLGLQVTEQKETAGLGSKITEKEFCNQFNNLYLTNNIKVDAITGATTSSNSVEKLLNKAFKALNNIK